MTVGLLSVNTIKMKNLTFLILTLYSHVGALSAQSAADCPANLSIFAEFAKVKNYDSAYTPWLEVKTHCPELNEATYIYGERILGHKIKNEEDNYRIHFDFKLSL